MERSLEDFKNRNTQPIQGRNMSKSTLRSLPRGGRGKVLRVDPATESGKRIVEMGVTPGTIVEVERIAPLGDPIDVRVKGYHLTLRRAEAEGIEVEPVQ
jgi:Fe2+ transport system protein FeoA